MFRLILFVSVVGYLAYSLVSIFYRICLHPLARFPGPKLWIAFPILKNFAQIKGNLDFQIRDLADKYGKIVRVGPEELVMTSAPAWKAIYGYGHPENPKYFPDFAAAHGSASNIINSNAQDHLRFRKAMQPAFSDKALKEQESLVSSYVELLVQRLRECEASGQYTNMVEWYTFTTFDIIGDLAYGQSFDGLREGNSNHWVENIENMMKLFPILSLAGSSTLLSRLFLFFTSGRITRSRNQHLKLTTELTEQRIKNKNQLDRSDFMSIIMRTDGKENGLSRAELVSNSDTLIVAGSETTATLLSGVTFYLLQTPSALQKCLREVRAAFKEDTEIQFATVTAKLPYMQACLNEALRLFPPVPIVLYRQVPPGQTIVVDNCEIPGKTRVGVHHLAAYHSESNFYRARSFCPERWLPEAVNNSDSPFFSDNRDACKPFSTGPRNCIGQNLAFHEMRLILARLLWSFDFELHPSCVRWADDQRIFALWEKPSLRVRIKSSGMPL